MEYTVTSIEYATLLCTHVLLCTQIRPLCKWLQGAVGSVDLGRFVWGLAVLDHLPKTVAARLYRKLASQPLTSFTAETLDQILQVICCPALCHAVLGFSAMLCFIVLTH